MAPAPSIDAKLEAARQAVAADPTRAEAHFDLALALHQGGALAAAVESYARTVELDPAHDRALGNLGIAQADLGLTAAARESLERAIAARPENPIALSNLGHLLDKTGEAAAAIAHLERAVELDPDLDIGWSNLGDAHRSLGAWDQAVEGYRRALKANPDFAPALANLAYALRTLCHWHGLEALEARLMRLSDQAIERGEESPIDPFIACFLDLAPRDFRRIVASHARRAMHRAAGSGRARSFAHSRPAGTPIRIGYVSAAFATHATGLLTRTLFRHHDRGRFAVFGYGLSAGDGSPIRAEIEAGMDRFRDLAGASIAGAAETIHRDRIDVLIDLDGFTKGNRSAIFALRPAPVQVAYLGFPGTLGAPYMDYIIADPVVAPPAHEGDFAERIVRLPDCYQVNSHRGLAVAPAPSRQRLGLPEEGFVFACFNVSRKVDARTFSTWLRILDRAPGAVLWLLVDGEEALANLRAEAGLRGVAPERLRAAARLDAPAHLARCQAADLFLDTLGCNAHTTATDALWAGLPVLSCPGANFASRVAASLLGAAGLGELACDSVAAYEDRAVALAAEPAAAARLRERLVAGRRTCALFDTARLVRSLEAAFAEMVRRHSRGEAPQAIDVAELQRSA